MNSLTFAETRATAAQTLPPFRDLNLTGIKDKVAEALSLIGRGHVFHEYTLHDIQHVNKMLTLLDWIVPPETAESMSPADWLLVVLSVYFHDLGMLVTDDEYENRQQDGFSAFCQHELFSGRTGEDYESKVATLGDDQERFLYQEFVRRNHAERISRWISGDVGHALGPADAAVTAVAEMLTGLPESFRSDLALVCASHHLDDLNDVERYRVGSPYGDSDDATANVQYAAILLRTVDLLHITHDRTPSVMFRLISPQDPVSQREWAKQEAVKRVRAQKGKDDAGNFDDRLPKNCVEVFATFDDADAFFGLTSYLAYAEKQLRQSHEWAETSALHFDIPYIFPWVKIDTSEIRTEGFESRQLSFTLDQEKILELLTGHTLYNDTSVVIRELVQNAVDATRLQALIQEKSSQDFEVVAEWNSESRELIIRDNGTGMTGAVIEKNLLKAGASRYQEDDFKHSHPDFSPISRFGIGVLSAFMIADFVEVTTCAEGETKARQLTLRTVHGRYLVRLMDKAIAAEKHNLVKSGTEIRLQVRKSAKIPDIAEALRRWVVVPRCRIRAVKDGATACEFAHASVKEALSAALESVGVELGPSEEQDAGDQVKIVERQHDGVSTAFAVVWSRYFRQWEFMRADRLPEDDSGRGALGTCIEGIRVEETSAGFEEDAIVALTDARGISAPKTNVARSGLDATNDRYEMERRVYRSMVDHVVAEAVALRSDRGQSLTWSAQESEIMLNVALEKEGPEKLFSPVDPRALKQEIADHDLILIELDGARSLRTVTSLREENRVWTVDSGLVRAAEEILREIPGDGSLAGIATGFAHGAFSPPPGITLVGHRRGSILHQLALVDREVGRIAIHREERRVDLGWDRSDSSPRWLPLASATNELGLSMGVGKVFLAKKHVDVDGLKDEVAVRAHDSFYLLIGSPIAEYVDNVMDRVAGTGDRRRVGGALVDIISDFFVWSKPPADMRQFVESRLGGGIARRPVRDRKRIMEQLDVDALVVALEQTPLQAFDTWAWHRRGSVRGFV